MVGLVMGVVILAFFSQLVLKKGKVRCASAASSCELADGSRNNSIHGDSKCSHVFTENTLYRVCCAFLNFSLQNTVTCMYHCITCNVCTVEPV